MKSAATRDLTPVQREAVTRAVRITNRYRGPWYGSDDHAQDAAEAVLRARVDSGRPEGVQVAYLTRRAVGGVIDALRAEARARAGWTRDGRSLAEHTSVAALADESTDPVGRVASRRALAALAALPLPLPPVALRLIEGHRQTDVAAELGLDPATVCRHVKRLRAALERHL